MSLPGQSARRRFHALGSYFAVPGRGSLTLRVRLCLVFAIILAPALILLGAMALRSIAAERMHMEESLGRTLNQLSVEIEREIRDTSALLTVIAGSHYLQSGDLEKFHQRASEISRQLGIRMMVRRPQLGERLITTDLPWEGAPDFTLPAIRIEAERKAIATGKIVISDVFLGPISQRYLVSAILPVTQNGNVEYVVSMAIPIAKIAGILENAPPGEGRISAVIDGSNIIVARSEKNDLYAGTKAMPEFVALAAGTEGAFDFANREGVVLHSVFKRLQSTGWIVVVGENTAMLDTSARNTIMYTAAAGTTLFAVAIGLTYLIGGRLEQRIGTLGIDRYPTRDEFALMFDSAPNGVVLVNDTEIMLLANARLERMFGYAQKELIGKSVDALIPNELRKSRLGPSSDLADNASTPPAAPERNRLGRRKDGSEFPIEIWLHPITIRSAQYTMATVIDITERSLAAEELTNALTERDRLRRRLMRSSEDERLRLSHELHDQTGQTLTAATLAAKDIEKFLAVDGRQRLTRLNGLLDQMGRTLHRIAWQLRPTSIDELGLRATLDNHLSDWSDHTGVDADFYCESRDVDHLPDDVRTTIYRIIQEALTNVVKHAPEANWVSVAVSRAGAVLQLTIENDGYGFDIGDAVGKPSKYGSLGIPGMRERLSLIGGTLEIESSEGHGTTVFARIPIEPSEALQ